jgi:hypothetical protein
MDTFIFETAFGGRQRQIGYKITADSNIRITSIAGVNVDRKGSPITKSDTVMKTLRRKAKLDYMRNMNKRATV